MSSPSLDPEATRKQGIDDLLSVASLGGGEPGSLPQTGIKGLMLAVLEDGVRAYLSSRAVVRAEAEHWISLRQRRSPFSFAVVCETLGLEPSAVRAALQRMRRQSSKPLRRSRPHAGRRTPLLSEREFVKGARPAARA